jgi:hypothetical protein
MHEHNFDPDRTDADMARATIGRESFVGEIVDHGFDRETLVVYLKDPHGYEHAVRPAYPTHVLQPLSGGAR